MKKLFCLLLFIPFIYACSSSDDDKPEPGDSYDNPLVEWRAPYQSLLHYLDGTFVDSLETYGQYTVYGTYSQGAKTYEGWIIVSWLENDVHGKYIDSAYIIEGKAGTQISFYCEPSDLEVVKVESKPVLINGKFIKYIDVLLYFPTKYHSGSEDFYLNTLGSNSISWGAYDFEEDKVEGIDLEKLYNNLK